MSVTPVPGTNAYVATGGQAVQAAPGGVNGGLIVNPMSPIDQGINGDPEPLYIDVVGQCPALQAGGTIFRIEPGQSWDIPAGQTTATWVNAQTAGHKFSVVTW